MGKALEGIRVLDMTHVQSGPSATQMLGYLGADVIKVELPGRGDITRAQLRDLPDVDSLYFTMLNCNKRSVTLNLKSEKGKEIFTGLIKACDVMVENFAPGVLDRQGFPWARVHEINPRLVYASIKGFSDGPYVDFKAYESIAQAMGGSMTTTGFDDGPPMCTGAQIGDSGTGMHCVAGILAALLQRHQTGLGQRVEVAMQDAVLNLCRVKLRDQQRLAHGPLREFPQFPNTPFDEFVPRSGNASGGGQPGAALRCAPGGQNDYVYVIIQPQLWEPLMKLCGRPELIADPAYATPEARLDKLDKCFAVIEHWTMQHSKWEVLETLNPLDVPCGPIMSTKELIEDKALRERGMVVDVPHPQRGTFTNLGCPMVLSDSPVEVRSSPLLGEHTAEILGEVMGYSKEQVEQLRAEGVV
jgi:formyl-CoA transferase